MFAKSLFVNGLLQETPEAVTAQVELWDRSNVVDTALSEATKRSAWARDAAAALDGLARKTRDYVDAHLAPAGSAEPDSAEEDPFDPFVAKFCRLAAHAEIRLTPDPEPAHLHEWGMQIERDAVKSLQEAGKPGMIDRLRKTAEDKPRFTGETIEELVRWVVQQTFVALDAAMRGKSPEEQAEIAGRIAGALRDLPPEAREQIRKAANLNDLTEETLKQAGGIAAVGVSLSTAVGLAGFSAYTTLVSSVHFIALLVGAHLSFGTYVYITSALAGITNPVLFVPAILGGGAFMTRRANRSIRGMLYPTSVATAAMAGMAANAPPRSLLAFAARFGEASRLIDASAGTRQLALIRRFPGLGNPGFYARAASNVV